MCKRLLFFCISYIISKLSIAEVVEWQTRRTQNPLVVIPCGFKSHLRHQIYKTNLEKSRFVFVLETLLIYRFRRSALVIVSAARFPSLAAMGRPPGDCNHCVAKITFFKFSTLLSKGFNIRFGGNIKDINEPISASV